MTAIAYAEFLAGKRRRIGDHGRACDPAVVHPFLRDWQAGHQRQQQNERRGRSLRGTGE